MSADMLHCGKVRDGHLLAAGIGGLAVVGMGRKALRTKAVVPVSVALTGGGATVANCKLIMRCCCRDAVASVSGAIGEMGVEQASIIGHPQ